MWSQMNTGRRMTKKWTRIVCKQANAGRGNRIEESKKDSESAITGNTDSPETIDKHIQTEVRTVQQQVKRMQARTVQTRKPQRQQLNTPQGRGK